MAIDPSTYPQFVGRITAADANYPYGSSKNETAPGAGDGTPYELGRANDVFGLQQALLYQPGIVPNGSADTAIASQYVGAIMRIASLGRYFADSGLADAYVLDPIGNVQDPTAYFDGMEAYFFPLNTNTGASTVNIAGLGAKNITLEGGTVLGAGDIVAGRSVLLRYNLANDRFVLPGLPFASVAEVQAATITDRATTPGRQAEHPLHPKAKVTFNGVAGAVILSQFNVASVTRISLGVYDIVFTNPLPDANYVIAGAAVSPSTYPNVFISLDSAVPKTANGCRISTFFVGVGLSDSAEVGVIFV